MIFNENYPNYIETYVAFWDLENLAYGARMFWNEYYEFFLSLSLNFDILCELGNAVLDTQMAWNVYY